MESKKIEELNSKLEKMEQIMETEGKNLSFDSIIVDCDHDYAVIKARKIAEGICRYVVVANRLIMVLFKMHENNRYSSTKKT